MLKKNLQKKNLDLIVLNSLNDKGAGFKTDTNKITIFNKALKKLLLTSNRSRSCQRYLLRNT